MFQRIMIAALVVIVVGMAASTYFSWQASRDTAEQFTEMNKQLGSLVQMQEADHAAKEPVPEPRTPEDVNTHKIFCALDEAGTPAANYSVEIVQRGRTRGKPSFRRTFTTDAEGWISTDWIPRLSYYVSGELNPNDDVDNPRPATWRQLILSGGPESTVETRIVIQSQRQHQVRLNLPAQLSWTEEQKKGLKIRFERHENSKEAHVPGSYTSRIYDITPGTTKTIEGLLPGPATAYLMLPGVRYVDAQDLKNPIGAWYRLSDIDVPDASGEIDLNIEIEPEQAVRGILYNGSRESPLANTQFEWITKIDARQRRFTLPGRTGTFSRTVYIIRSEALRTDDEGRFQAFCGVPKYFTPSFDEPDQTPKDSFSGSRLGKSFSVVNLGSSAGIALDWHTVDGKPIRFTWPVFVEPIKTYHLVDAGRFFEINLSTLATLRVVVTGPEDLRAQGHSVRDLLEFNWIKGDSDNASNFDWKRHLDVTRTKSSDLPLFPGRYVFFFRMPLTEYDKDVPDFEQRGTYTKRYNVTLNPGELKELEISVADLEKWKRGGFEWHKRSGRQPVTTQPAASQPVANSGGRPRSGQVDP